MGRIDIDLIPFSDPNMAVFKKLLEKIDPATGTFYTDTIYEQTSGSGVTIDGVLLKDSNIVALETPVNIGTGTPYTVLAANTGKLHLIPDMAANSAINLPTAAAGLHYKFMYVGAAADAHDHTINTGSASNFYVGAVGFQDSDGTALDFVVSDNNSNAILTINNAASGTFIEVWCDGTKWYINGMVHSDTAPAFSDIS